MTLPKDLGSLPTITHNPMIYSITLDLIGGGKIVYADTQKARIDNYFDHIEKLMSLGKERTVIYEGPKGKISVVRVDQIAAITKQEQRAQQTTIGNA